MPSSAFIGHVSWGHNVEHRRNSGGVERDPKTLVIAGLGGRQQAPSLHAQPGTAYPAALLRPLPAPFLLEVLRGCFSRPHAPAVAGQLTFLANNWKAIASDAFQTL
ncbi:hypothetical protein NW766_001617 [Fusarium irregulare]|uniref:Uncharacterized protein n=1 Tax=Fusarium irregulare TaxID=2494466 RepID=A0A9W8UFC0_9HYPO|nr:hypothetical protein NW766_001617 [Fusarium irregulare]